MSGIQQKLIIENQWIKFDRFGYEGLAEVIAYRFSKLIKSKLTFLEYNPIYINHQVGCVSLDANKRGMKLISLLELFMDVKSKPSENELIDYYIPQIIKITHLRDFGEWMTDLFLFDMLIENEDRNAGNILLYKGENGYEYAPIMDNTNSLLYRLKTCNNNISIPTIAKPLLISHEEQCKLMIRNYNTDFGLIDNKVFISDLFNYYSKSEIEQACQCLKNNTLRYFGILLDFV